MLYAKLFLVLIISFFASLVLSPLLISLIKREKVNQVILHYVESHKQKSGTPTMGGIIFIVSICLVSLLFFDKQSMLLGTMCLVIFVSYGIVGFLDDFIKFKFRRNLGLRAYQKIIFQLAIAIFISVFAFKNNFVGSSLILPFSKRTIDFGYFIIPLNILVILAITNSVNLTDGLDGLATGTTLSYFATTAILLLVLFGGAFAGQSEVFTNQLSNIYIVVFSCVGALLCYLLFNCFPAKIFMGDTGSLALGALVGAVAIFTKTTLYLPIIGIMFVLSSVSVIMQVAYYKITKKRIFLMAPLHHHFEKKGMHEVRISVMYSVITLLVGIVVVLIELA